MVKDAYGEEIVVGDWIQYGNDICEVLYINKNIAEMVPGFALGTIFVSTPKNTGFLFNSGSLNSIFLSKLFDNDRMFKLQHGYLALGPHKVIRLSGPDESKVTVRM